MLPSYAEASTRGIDIDTTDASSDPRLDELTAWVRRLDDLADASISPASEDASFRRYFRARTARVSRIIMDAPPLREDSRPFVRIAGYLERMGLNAPRVLEADFDRGFLLLTDLGSTPYLTALRADPPSAARLYGDALAALSAMQDNGRAFQSELPPFDRKLLTFELSLFRDWLCGRYLELEFATADERAWQRLCECLVESALMQPRVFVHRDYHSRNLMLTAEGNPGILDFQDAVEGPLTYDLVSLLKDCYIEQPADWVHERAMEFHAHAGEVIAGAADAAAFRRAFELMGVQRHLKAAGIFARLHRRDGKPSFMNDVPRTLGYVLEIAPRYDELAFLARLIRERVLPLLGSPR